MESSNKTKHANDILQFHEMELDDRILKAIAELGWKEPTPIQEKAIPLLLQGKDLLVRARTGSGKTGAFLIPIIQKILLSKQLSNELAIKALVLAPSKELCDQIHRNVMELCLKCSRSVRCVNISPEMDVSLQGTLLKDIPDIVVGTPSRTKLHLKAATMELKKSLEFFVVDEADLTFSFGCEEISDILQYLPRIYQSVLASATLSEDVLSLKRLVLHSPVLLKLEEPDLAPLTQLTHYYVYAEEEEKAVILYTQLKLDLLPGKTIIFVNTVDRCYKLKLFLEQFGIATCVLNSELPASSRCHAIKQFNSDIYKTLIASDELALEGVKLQQANDDHAGGKRKRDKESGVARGIDFQHVYNIINFDFPLDTFSYVHRAGRTARGIHKGNVLSFVNIREQKLMQKMEEYLQSGLRTTEDVFTKYNFSLADVEGFRYRAKDAWRAVTRIAVREARLKEIKREIINSKKLKAYFEENPRDLKTLRHDKALHTVKLQEHLSHVPDYLIPKSLKSVIRNDRNAGDRKKKNNKDQKIKFKTGRNKAFNRYVGKQSRSENPLETMKFDGFKEDDIL